jgi:hypothetical protein
MATNLPNSKTSSQNLVTPAPASNSAVYDKIYSFFQTKTSSISAAEQLTQTVITLTNNNSLDPMAIITQFDLATNDNELKILLIALCNSLRPSTSKIGYQHTITYNQWIQRNIVA